MVQIPPKPLIDKLNTFCRQALEQAAGVCATRTNYNVEVEHWLLTLVEPTDTDLAALLRFYEVDTSRLISDLTARVDSFKTGNSRAPALSPDILSLLREAWLIASVQFDSGVVRTGHILAGLLSTSALERIARDASAQFLKVSSEALLKDLPDIVAETIEAGTAQSIETASPPGSRPASAIPGGKTPALDQLTIDLTQQARDGKIDPVVGRDEEIRQVIDILTRRRQNNPILTGEAGVGKTAVVEGFALRIAKDDVPPPLKGVIVRTLDLGLLQAGAGVKGEFENRLKNVIAEVKASIQPIILFIDEAHMMIGAGGSAGQGDAANLLKPALARGELRTIAATTWAEYKEFFEKDAALTRRFQVVKVEEPEEDKAIEMMQCLVGTLEKHHGVRLLDEAVRDAVRLSNRYISGRQLPDKSVSLLDTACARVGLSQSATPAPIEDCRRRIQQTDVTIGILERETARGVDHSERLAELAEKRSAADMELAALESQWEREQEIAAEMRGILDALDGKTAEGASEGEGDAAASAAPADPEAQRQQLQKLAAQLTEVQGESALVQVNVGSDAVADVVSNWTGIPVGRMVTDEIHSVLQLKDRLGERIIGQSDALEAIAESIRTSRANLTDPRRPIGVFLMVGTSGVGKTETAIALTELLYGGEQNMTVINMSEFKEEHKVSLLMGSPPGYVGYGKGGVLTEAVRRRPYSVVLLDEMEKAHPGVQDIFYQVFDKGTLTDGEGRDIDFRNTVIIMTSNAGTDEIKKLCADPDTRPSAPKLAETLHPTLTETYRPAFLGRVTLLPYLPLVDEDMRKIIELQLGRIERRVLDSYKAKFSYAPELVASIASRCQEVDTGARNIDHILSRGLLPEMSARFLARLADGESIRSVHVGIDDSQQFTYEIA